MELGNSNQNEVNYDVPTDFSVHRTFQWTWSKFSDHKNVIYHFGKKNPDIVVVSYPKSNHSNHENRGTPYKIHTLHKSKGICSTECSRETLQKTPTQFRNNVIGDRKMTKGK